MLNRYGKIGPALVMLVPVAGTSKYLAVTDTAAVIQADMTEAGVYVFTADVDCYIKQGADPTASAANGSMLVSAGMPVVIDGAQGAKLSVVRKADSGVATLQKVAALL